MSHPSLPLQALVIGAGPAGLMAAEELARSGVKVVVCDAKPSVGRKFLMAGKSGLNITKDEPCETFVSRYDTVNLHRMLSDFGPKDVQDWCRALGQDVYTGSSGRVFPVAMKASPLLRAWLNRLASQGVDIRTRWRWTGFEGGGLRFETPIGPRALAPCVTVLALGGASWQRLGSDAAWVPWLREKGVAVTDWRPANMGFRVDWSPQMSRFFGSAVKGIALLAGARRVRGEIIVSAKGVEGGGIYSIYKDLYAGAPLALDLFPDLTREEINRRLARQKPRESTANRLRKLGLDPVKLALVMEVSRHDPFGLLKSLYIPLRGPRPIDEAISTAGGIAWDGLTPDLELKALPGIFAAGEMLDWESPTGGYLLTACWATGRWAGHAAARHIAP